MGVASLGSQRSGRRQLAARLVFESLADSYLAQTRRMVRHFGSSVRTAFRPGTPNLCAHKLARTGIYRRGITADTFRPHRLEKFQSSSFFLIRLPWQKIKVHRPSFRSSTRKTDVNTNCWKLT